jgi:hypothetical protein
MTIKVVDAVLFGLWAVFFGCLLIGVGPRRLTRFVQARKWIFLAFVIITGSVPVLFLLWLFGHPNT